MVYYVAYRVPSELKHGSQVAHQLRALRCRQIQKYFWAVDKKNIAAVAEILRANSPLFLKRTREIRKPALTEEKTYGELGSLIVVACKFPKAEDAQKIKNFLKRVPCIRLCRGVYAFSQRHERFDRNQRLVDARGFWEYARQIDDSATAIPRLIVVNNESAEMLLEETKRRVEKEVSSLVQGYKVLFLRLERGDIDMQRAVAVRRKLRRRFRLAKEVATFYKEWLKMDFSSVMVRPYPVIRKVRSLIGETYGGTL